MKPALGQTVYCIYNYSITKTKVYAIGEDFFMNETYSDGAIFNSWFYYFDEYGSRWFTSLKEAKKKLKESFGSGKIVRFDEDYWEIQE